MMRKWLSVFLVVLLGFLLWHTAAVTYDPMYGAIDENAENDSVVNTKTDQNVITLWYTDEALTDYLSSVALSFQQNTGVKVNLVLKNGVEFLENINEVSIAAEGDYSEEMPDLYITSHDNLLRGYLAGLASVVSDPQGIMKAGNFPNTALNAVTCYGEYVGYPLYYETNFFLYNKTYMASIAQNRIEALEDRAEGEAAAQELENEGAKETPSDDEDTSETEPADGEEGVADGDADPMGQEDAKVSQEVLEQLSTMIPATMDDVTTFANNYDAPDAVESVFKWDISDIFYNYFFVGNYMEVGGEAGDNAAIFNIYNQQAIQCLTAYQGMNQFFSMDTKNDTYDNILQDFIDGKMVFTVATTDAIAKIHEAQKQGKFDFEYGVTTLPDVNNLLKARGLSVTEAVAINGYSTKQNQANIFASYLVNNKAGEIYDKTGKVSCNKNVVYEDVEISNIMAEYEKSVPLPKMVEAANYWVQLEIAFTKVWAGADPDETLKELSDTIGAQIEEIRINLPTQESFGAGAFKLIE